jgi:hypothetical protein
MNYRSTGIICLVFCLLTFAWSAAVAHGQAVVYDRDYSDPASDVTWIFGNGSYEMRDEPKDVNIKWLRSELVGDTLRLTIELSNPGQVRTDNATVYQLNIYTTTGNASHFIVNYSDGDCALYTNTSSNIINGSVEHTVSGGELVCFVSLAQLGDITYYNLDASAQTYGYENATVGWVLKKDFGWELPGNPGSTPEDVPESGTPGFGLWTLLVAGGVAYCLVYLAGKRPR